MVVFLLSATVLKKLHNFPETNKCSNLKAKKEHAKAWYDCIEQAFYISLYGLFWPLSRVFVRKFRIRDQPQLERLRDLLLVLMRKPGLVA